MTLDLDMVGLKRNVIALQGTCSGVYFLFEGDELVYVGEGWNCALRVAEHTRKESKKVFSSWTFLPMEDERERKALEREVCLQYKPKYNGRHACRH